MSQFPISEPAEAILEALGEALDLVHDGILLLNRDMRVRFVNRRFADTWGLPAALIATAPTFRELLNHVGDNVGYSVPAAELPAYLEQRMAAVCAGSIPPTEIDLSDGRRLLFTCSACPGGGRILTHTDMSRVRQEQELRQETDAVLARIGADLRFSNEIMESQAAYLASLAEGADENARQAEAARRQLECEIAERRQLEAQLRRLATTDALTGALNRAELLASGQQALETAFPRGQGLAVLMLDVDHFKAINDRYGHPGGDLALQHLVTILRGGIRPADLLGRLGGEEFAIVLPAIPAELAERVAERLRARVADSPPQYGEALIPMTVSIGLALQQEADRSIEQLIVRADAALYRAKRGGRNRVVHDHPAVGT